MENISFSAHQLIVGTKNANFDVLRGTLSKGEDHFKYDDTHYQITKLICNNNRFFWMYAGYGKPLPRTKKVIDTKSNEFEENPRKPSQIEPNRQIFCLYDIKSEILYLSNHQKKKFFETYLKSKINHEVIVKNFYVNPDQFAARIKNIDSVRLITSKNLFSQATDVFSEAKNIFGLGEPEEFIIQTRFKNASTTSGFIKILKNFAKQKQTGEINSLVCKGRDEKNIEVIFNIDYIIDKINVTSCKNEQGLFENEAIKNALISKIYEIEKYHV